MNNRFLWQAMSSGLLTLSFSGVRAEAAYVTDMLQLEMYQTSEFIAPPIRKLRSGDKVELLEKQGRYAHVKAEDGLEGWVKSLYLVSDEPARTRLNKLESTNSGLEKTIKKLRSQLESEKGKVSELTEAQDGSASAAAETAAELERLRDENASMTEKLDAYGTSVPLKWLLIAAGITLLGGLLGGWYFVDSRSRARHGGYRIY